MADQPRSDAFQQGAEAGRDINKQAGDCPYDHDLVAGELQRRTDWMEGFASTRQEAASATEASDYRLVGHKAAIRPDLPVYID